ncbi:hypothetical protein ElyMa_003948200 [Elysia marginata]|uniref:Uncharacterized protein n=1 Tax=Elysia marginata TaxID=1093978 RepID=A0AAV4FV28_9GAST|nr:hypothetical protein ElyMa_003948200 [Elysia marginata]
MAIISISKADLPSTTRAFHGTVSKMDDESLILCVQQRPAIYDKKEKLHHNRGYNYTNTMGSYCYCCMGWTQIRLDLLYIRSLLLHHNINNNNNKFLLLLHAIFTTKRCCLTVGFRFQCGRRSRQKNVGSGLTVGSGVCVDLTLESEDSSKPRQLIKKMPSRLQLVPSLSIIQSKGCDKTGINRLTGLLTEFALFESYITERGQCRNHLSCVLYN